MSVIKIQRREKGTACQIVVISLHLDFANLRE